MRHLIAAVLLGSLAACGGGGGGSSTGTTGGGTPSPPPPPPPPAKPSAADAARLLTQATFGVTSGDITAVQNAGFSAWIDSQIAAPLPNPSNDAYVVSRLAQLGSVSSNQFLESWWKQVANEPGQLRQRVAFALSQIFVVSYADSVTDTRGGASYYDMLEGDAFGNFRKLLDDVTLHPAMGLYLTYLANLKEDPAGTRTPDENYAREVMQLMTIGLVQLNTDGTVKTDATGAPIPTYTPDDIKGLAKVFTGISWYNAAPTNSTFFGGSPDPNRYVTPMIYYPQYHSTSAKSFLGVTIPASTTADTAGDVKIALDTLFNHPNVGPFISFRLIQQLVTSNPSSAYVGRVAAVFNNNGAGVRGDLGAVVKAVLTDTEARDATVATSTTFGKLREPVIRVANWARSFGAVSQSGNWLITSTSANTSLGESAMTSPSVFNFWRPGFTPSGTSQLGTHGLVAPEFQIVDEVSSAAWVNNIQTWVDQGIGSAPPAPLTGRDVRSSYATEMAIADTPSALVAEMNTLLFSGEMSTALQATLTAAIAAVPVPGSTGANQAAIDAAHLNRVKTAIFLSMISPEYLVQR